MTTKQVIRYFGSAIKVAAALDISSQAVNNWGKKPPVARQYQIQVLTKGKLKADK